MESYTEKYTIRMDGPSSLYQGEQGTYTIGVTGYTLASAVDPATVELYASGSNSMPPEDHDGPWEHLIPRWWFEDEDGNRITSTKIDLTCTNQKVGDMFVCVGSKNIKFTDQYPKNPVSVVATYIPYNNPNINSKEYSIIPVNVKSVAPSKLQITRNGSTDPKDKLNTEIYWKDLCIPFVVTVVGTIPNTSKDVILYDFPYEDNIEVPARAILKYNDAANNQQEIQLDPFRLHDSDGNYFRTGGYVVGSVSPSGMGTNCEFAASAFSTRYGCISGEEKNVEIDDYNYHIRKFNDSWNTTKHMAYATGVVAFKDNSDDLFNKFINGALGGSGSVGEYSIGRKIYEAIANQVENVHDVDECGIEALYSLANSQDVPLDAFAIYAPEELKRAMDLFSVTHEKLWGDRCHCNKFYFIDNSTRTYRNSEGKIVTEKDRHIKKLCPFCGHIHGTNVGDSADDLISIKLDEHGEHPPYLVRPKKNGTEFMKIVPSVESISQSKKIVQYLDWYCKVVLLKKAKDETYSLDDLEKAIKNIWTNDEIASEDKERAFKDATMWYSLLLLVQREYRKLSKCTSQDEITKLQEIIRHKQLVALHTSLFTPQPWTNYCFFQFLDRQCGVQNTGVIKWEDKNTEVDEGRVDKEKASIDHWLKEHGTVDRIMSYIMRKNLGY